MFAICILTFLFANIIIANADECESAYIDLFNNCLEKGFNSSISGCNGADVSSLKKKEKQKCRQYETKLKICNYTCIVDGGWSDFEDWSECSADCGDGVQTRSRSCNNPAPAHGGAECEGDNTESRSCYKGQCRGTCEGSVCLKGDTNFIALPVGSRLNSPNGDYFVAMQTDGNLVLYCKGNPIWWTGTHGTTVSGGLFFQTDGNLVLYNPEGNPLWNSETYGTEASTMVMQDDGNFVLYTDDQEPVWYTGTNGRC